MATSDLISSHPRFHDRGCKVIQNERKKSLAPYVSRRVPPPFRLSSEFTPFTRTTSSSELNFQAITRHRSRNSSVQAAVTAEAPAAIYNKYSLPGNCFLEVSSYPAKENDRGIVELRIIGGRFENSQLIAHWGAVRIGERGWTLPGLRPDGTKIHKNRALQSPFRKEGDALVLRIETTGNKYEAVEFTLKDESTNSWYKNGDGNFRVAIPASTAGIDASEIVIPMDILQVQAYLNWEKNGKQAYSPEKEKEEFEKTKEELQQQVASGAATIEGLRLKLIGGGSSNKSEGSSNGNGNGKGSAPAAAKQAAPPKKKQAGSSVLRKSRDLTSLINRYDKGQPTAASVEPPKPRELSKVGIIAQQMDSSDIISKRIHKFGPHELLVVASVSGQGASLLLVSSVPEKFILHWGLVKGKGREWMNVQQTEFLDGFGGEANLQHLQVLVPDAEGYEGIPFVLNAGNNWYKDSGSDFFVSIKPRKVEPATSTTGGDGQGTAKALLDDIADAESEAEKSLMHRFNLGASFLESALPQGELGLAGVLVWFRYSSTRQLVWNKNYNVKPREISTAQDRMTDSLRRIFQEQPPLRDIVRMIMMTVGRGGEGDVGQRIRDEILVIQRANDCAGGMMEEWHQKLHNNTSPDDVVICQALLDYLQSNFDLDVYWKTLNSNGVNRERLASYDRAIRSEPKFRPDQRDGLIRDLTNYMKSLKAVHSGADLESAIATCMGYRQGANETFMQTVEIHPISGLSSELPALLQTVLEHVEDRKVVTLLEGLIEARHELRPTLLRPHNRLKDLIFLDLALDSTVRTAVERGMEHLSDPQEIMYVVSLVIENILLSSADNEELVYSLKDWQHAMGAYKGKAHDWALRAKAITDRSRLLLSDRAEALTALLQPSANYLGSKLRIDSWAVSIFSEEMVRSGSAASLSLLLNKLDPILRKAADMGSWQVISPVAVKGFVEVVDELGLVQDIVYSRPTILVAGRVRGEEEIPEGVVALLTPDMPDILSHVSVRARNSRVCFATCFDDNVLADLRSYHSKTLALDPTPSADLSYKSILESEVLGSVAVHGSSDAVPTGLAISKKVFSGRYAVTADEFSPALVGAKSRNIAGLRGKLPEWIQLPTSVALPFGSFDAALADPINNDVSAEIEDLLHQNAKDASLLPTIRETVLKLKAPAALVSELKAAMKASGMPWPGDESQERWEQAWLAIKKVWASKWNERAYFSTRKVGLNHADLSMAVLVQEIIQADYAYVIHTTNPSTEDPSEIYAEVVKGLGETLVGAYAGRALSLSARKDNIKEPKVLGFPSKRIGLFIKQSIIFRSDSNGEDLEGYAGAGLYDSVPMDVEEEVVVDYSSDPLLRDMQFQRDVLSKIARVGLEIEKALGSAQDIEGVVKDGKIYVVQTRPQM